ncbi:MAG: hypothetical protein KKF50_04870 [Nanoarchaeota archaeon]|nr:hypothetical protein [Nanoarchaeota archaeon]
MKKWQIIVGIIVAVLIIAFGVNYSITGSVVGGPLEGMSGGDDEMMGGPTDADMACMVECTIRGCDESDMECRTVASVACGSECGVESEQPAPADESEACMQECIAVGCDEFDFSCQRLNQAGCDDKCGMKGDAPDESEMDEEQLCISNCVAAEDPSVICGNSREGETGNALCQRCASECVHLYAGPCLNDEQISEKEEACKTCEHCYGSIVEGPSGQGWDCIIDIECADASGEFGDDAGTGDASFEEGHEGKGVIATVGGAISDVFSGIGNFFKGLFS